MLIFIKFKGIYTVVIVVSDKSNHEVSRHKYFHIYSASTSLHIYCAFYSIYLFYFILFKAPHSKKDLWQNSYKLSGEQKLTLSTTMVKTSKLRILIQYHGYVSHFMNIFTLIIVSKGFFLF